LVLLALALVWIVVLTPAYLKKRSERSSTGSIESFHHQLHLLERTGPKLVEPAYRLETTHNAPPLTGASGYPVVSSAPNRANLVLLRPMDEEGAATEKDEVVDDRVGTHYRRVAVLDPPDPPAEAHRGPDPYRRQLARRRRRDTLGVLAATFVLTALLGVVHSLRLLWVVSLVSGLALMAYVALTVYAQSLQEERRQLERARGAPYDPASGVGNLTYADGYDEPDQAVAAR